MLRLRKFFRLRLLIPVWDDLIEAAALELLRRCLGTTVGTAGRGCMIFTKNKHLRITIVLTEIQFNLHTRGFKGMPQSSFIDVKELRLSLRLVVGEP